MTVCFASVEKKGLGEVLPLGWYHSTSTSYEQTLTTRIVGVRSLKMSFLFDQRIQFVCCVCPMMYHMCASPRAQVLFSTRELLYYCLLPLLSLQLNNSILQTVSPTIDILSLSLSYDILSCQEATTCGSTFPLLVKMPSHFCTHINTHIPSSFWKQQVRQVLCFFLI